MTVSPFLNFTQYLAWSGVGAAARRSSVPVYRALRHPVARVRSRRRPAQAAPPAGFEPATLSLEGTCSVQLSYRGLDYETIGLPSRESNGWVFCRCGRSAPYEGQGRSRCRPGPGRPDRARGHGSSSIDGARSVRPRRLSGRIVLPHPGEVQSNEPRGPPRPLPERLVGPSGRPRQADGSRRHRCPGDLLTGNPSLLLPRSDTLRVIGVPAAVSAEKRTGGEHPLR